MHQQDSRHVVHDGDYFWYPIDRLCQLSSNGDKGHTFWAVGPILPASTSAYFQIPLFPQSTVYNTSRLLPQQPNITHLFSVGLVQSDVVHKRGEPAQQWRFCFQCGKLEPLERFDGKQR